jgi:DNA-binding MarR family transcriptional regulator
MMCLAQHPELPLREVALQVGITERAVQRIVADLEEAGYLKRERLGRHNRYRFNRRAKLRHPLEAHRTIGDLIKVVTEQQEG